MSKNDKIIRLIKSKILGALSPERIIIFGSAARNKAGEVGDIDVLVVCSSDKTSPALAKELELVFFDRDFPLDILVCSIEDEKKFRNVAGSMLNHILHNGKIIYDRAA